MQLPNDFVTKYTQLLGETEAKAFLASYNQPANSGFRLNPLKPDPKNVTLSLDEPINYSPYGYVGKVDGNAIDHVSGYVYSQEPSAQLVGAVANAQPGQTVLDLCAAPGGKSTYLAGAMANQGVLVSNEINLGRARVLGSNIERWGARNVIVTNHDPASLAKVLPEAFDMILVDAPCSGEGMFRKDPDAMSYWSLDYPGSCAIRQREILTEAIKMLKPGGTLVYSTCTFAPEEDEQMMAWLLDHSDLSISPITHMAGMSSARPEWADGRPELAGAVRLWPHQQLGEGHFVCRLTRPGVASEPAPRKKNKKSRGKQAAGDSAVSRDERTLWQDWAQANLTQTLTGTLTKQREQLYLLPNNAPDISQLRVVRPGLHLGTLKKNRFEPSHSLATALLPEQFNLTVAVNDDEYQHYRHGETLQRPDLHGKSSVLLTNADKGFAIGRLVNGTIKNMYPKGLRV